MKRNEMLFFSLAAMIIMMISVVFAPPTIHSLIGEVFYSDGSDSVAGIPVWINLTWTNITYLSYTDGPPFSPNDYLYDVNGNDSEYVIVRAWNETHWGENNTNLSEGSGDTYCNVILDTLRGSETNVTITQPANNTLKDFNDLFNITANVSIIGDDATSCTAVINISNRSVINISSTDSLSHALGNINWLDYKNTTWELRAVGLGSVNVSVNATCSSDSTRLDNIYTGWVYNITIQSVAPIINLENPADNNTSTSPNVNLYYNVSSGDQITNCSLIINNQFNQTDTSIQKDTTQSFSLTDLGNGQYNWSINCTDSSLLSSVSEIRNLTVSAKPDFLVANITFSNSSPVENQNITITANISNIGQVDAQDVIVQFFLGNYSNEIQIGENRSLNIGAGSWNTTNVSYEVNVGITNVYVVVDPPLDSHGDFSESDEENNYANNSVSVPSYHSIIGNVTGELLLGDSTTNSLIRWDVTNYTGSNVYIADSDFSISFLDLQALTRDVNGIYQPDDFSDADVAMNMTGLSDSINNTYSKDGQPVNTDNITVFGLNIENVPIINSTNSSGFVTGILWDTSYDTNDVYDQTEKEPLVFVAKVNQANLGYYGIYDYESKVPARLREYNDTTMNSVSIYLEIR